MLERGEGTHKHRVALPMVDGVRVVVPQSLNLITPYVLLEQHDWFEDEIKFVRRVLAAGDNAIDIGANYGVYALSMARAVGPSGRVWAFEPSSGTAKLLAESISTNGFTHCILERSALSNRGGKAQLSLKENSELNALVDDASSAGSSETVALTTLDECMERHGWHDIAFVKIDAEGEESNILRGGRRFFRELSPLVQYEVKAGSSLHLELVREFAALGYDSCSLVPGLDLLAPFDAEATPDEYLLNLFCCKRDRADQLAARGFLVMSSGPMIDQDAKVQDALSQYAASRDASRPSSERFEALKASFALLRKLCDVEAPGLRLASLARVGRDFGARSVAVNALRQLSTAGAARLQEREPFLAPSQRFDSIPRSPDFGKWAMAAILEEFERLVSYSSFYTGLSARPRLEAIRSLGFGSPEMERRLRLVLQRFGANAQ
jgi:FkbM family methyltransferase